MTDPTPSAVPSSGSSRTAIQSGFGWRLWMKMQVNSRLLRWVLGGGGPARLLVTLAIMAGMTVWWSSGAAGVDQIAMPLILFPAIWVCVFVYALLEDRFGQAVLAMLALVLGNGALVFVG